MSYLIGFFTPKGYLIGMSAFHEPVFWVFTLFAVPISIVDFQCKRIPDVLSLPCLCLVFILRIEGEAGALPNFLAAALFGGLLFGAIRALSRGIGLGLGDVKYAVLLGLVCGFPGILSCLFIASVLGLTAAPFLIRGKADASIPFAPFLSAAGFLTCLLFPSL